MSLIGDHRCAFIDTQHFDWLEVYVTESVHLKPISPFSPTSEIVPSYDSAVYKIHPFRSVAIFLAYMGLIPPISLPAKCRDLQSEGEAIYSKPLNVYGMRWRLKVYPVSTCGWSIPDNRLMVISSCSEWPS